VCLRLKLNHLREDKFCRIKEKSNSKDAVNSSYFNADTGSIFTEKKSCIVNLCKDTLNQFTEELYR
jgi:hypothetical protein